MCKHLAVEEDGLEWEVGLRGGGDEGREEERVNRQSGEEEFLGIEDCASGNG